MGVNDCQCLGAQIVRVAMDDRGRGWLNVGHVTRAALDRIAVLMGAEPTPIAGPDGSRFLVLDAARDGLRVYAQAYELDGGEVAARIAAMVAEGAAT